jgi:hypothetical protein
MTTNVHNSVGLFSERIIVAKVATMQGRGRLSVMSLVQVALRLNACNLFRPSFEFPSDLFILHVILAYQSLNPPHLLLVFVGGMESTTGYCPPVWDLLLALA